jgi:hypothetical protein
MKPLTTEQTPANVNRVLELLAQTPDRLAELSRDLDDDALRQPLGPGRRSRAEILAHLLNIEARNHEAIILALTHHEPLLTHVHPERDYGRLLRYDLLPYTDCLAYFRFRRVALLRVLASLAAQQWARTIQEPGKKRRESVYWRVRSMALHELEHLAEFAGDS